MPYVIFYYVIICYVFSEATTTSWEFDKFHRKTPMLESFFPLKWWNYIKTFVLLEFFSDRLMPWASLKYNRSIILQGTFLWIFGKWFMKTPKKPIHFTTNSSQYRGHRHLEVLWSFILHIFWRFVLSLKSSHYAYILLYMHKTLPTLGIEKEQ